MSLDWHWHLMNVFDIQFQRSFQREPLIFGPFSTNNFRVLSWYNWSLKQGIVVKTQFSFEKNWLMKHVFHLQVHDTIYVEVIQNTKMWQKV